MKKTRITALILVMCMLSLCLTSCVKPKIAMEYEGESITTNMYSYWMSQIKSGYVSAANDTDEYWATKYSNGETYEQKMREIVDFNVKVNLVCQKLFKDMGLSISESQQKELDDGLADLLKSYGSKGELNGFLSAYNINYDMLGDIYEIELKTSIVYDALYAAGGPREMTKDKLEAYFKENYACVDIIMIYTPVEYVRDSEGKIVYDENTGNPKTKELTDEEIEAKKKKADEIMTKIENGEDFDTLMAQYNEDPNKDTYTEGYFISSNDLSVYGSEIVVAAQKMEIGDVKRVDDGSAICIMKRKELNEKAYENEAYSDQLGNLVSYCQQNDFNLYMNELIKGVVVNNEEVSKVSVKEAALIG